jgi:uncharacterized protein YdaU (DUF1376 family)
MVKVVEMKHERLAPGVARFTPALAANNALPMLPWFPSSFMASTRGWSVTARGIYRELLDAQWDLGSLPADLAALKRLIGATNAEWKSWPLVASKFPLCVTDGVRRNPTLERHRSKSVELKERHQRGAAETNSKRWGAQPDQRFGQSGRDGH